MLTIEEGEKVSNVFAVLDKILFKEGEKKGWHENPINDGEQIALIHSELSEGLEALRENLMSDKIPEYLGIEEELADTIIRIIHYASRKNYRLGWAIVEKMKYNQDRPYRHGNKRF